MTGMQVFFAAMSLIIPFVAVIAAHQVAAARDRKQQILNLLVKVGHDVREFQISAIDNRLAERIEANTKAWREKAKSDGLAYSESWSEKHEKEMFDSREKLSKKANQHARLAGDEAALRLLIGSRSKALKDQLAILLTREDTFSLPPFHVLLFDFGMRGKFGLVGALRRCRRLPAIDVFQVVYVGLELLVRLPGIFDDCQHRRRVP